MVSYCNWWEKRPIKAAWCSRVERNPRRLQPWQGLNQRYDRWLLKGSLEASQALIQIKGLVGTEDEQRQLCDRYSCNPLALKIVATSIQDVFAGEIAPFLAEGAPLFNSLQRLLVRQFERLSPLEHTIMVSLAINRDWTSLAELVADIVPAVSKGQVLEALESLSWRSLIEQTTSTLHGKTARRYTQQPVVMEYVTDRLIERVCTEIVEVLPHWP